MTQFFAFIAVTALWAALCRFVLEFAPVHPFAVGAVWLVGFLWMTGYIASGPRDADHLVKVWVGMLAGMTAVAAIGAWAFS